MIRFEYNTHVYYKDVDQMGIVYYNRYYEYFEAARTELLRKTGIDVSTIEASGYYLPVITSHCDYLSGAKFDDELIVETVIRELPKLKLKIEYTITKIDEKDVLAKGYTIHVFTTKEDKPVRPPKDLLNKLEIYFQN